MVSALEIYDSSSLLHLAHETFNHGKAWPVIRCFTKFMTLFALSDVQTSAVFPQCCRKKRAYPKAGLASPCRGRTLPHVSAIIPGHKCFLGTQSADNILERFSVSLLSPIGPVTAVPPGRAGPVPVRRIRRKLPPSCDARGPALTGLALVVSASDAT